MRNALYGVMIGCYLLAGLLDMRAGRPHAAGTAWVFAVANAWIFYGPPLIQRLK